MEFFEKTIKKEYVYKGKILNARRDVVSLPDGGLGLREVIEHGGGVCTAALTEGGELIFVRQFRYPYSETTLELPAGKLEKGEDPLEAGKRELEEEAGVVAEKYYDFGKFYPSPGYCGEIISLYAATGLSETKMNLDDDEFLEVERLPVEKAVDMVLSNQIPDGKTQTLVMRVAEALRRGLIERTGK